MRGRKGLSDLLRWLRMISCWSCIFLRSFELLLPFMISSVHPSHSPVPPRLLLRSNSSFHETNFPLLPQVLNKQSLALAEQGETIIEVELTPEEKKEKEKQEKEDAKTGAQKASDWFAAGKEKTGDEGKKEDGDKKGH